MASKRVLVYGAGALGSVLVKLFKNKGYWVSCVDTKEIEFSDNCIIVDKNGSWSEQESLVLSQIGNVLLETPGSKLDGIVCVAGGWAGGNAANKKMIQNADTVWKQSVWSSSIAASVAAHHLNEGGTLILTGAASVYNGGTPGMIGYGMAKAAVHHLTRSLAENKSGLPKDAFVCCILPDTLDTPMNRKMMPKGDTSNWTPLDILSEKISQWVDQEERPISGSLVKVLTKNGQTTFEVVSN